MLQQAVEGLLRDMGWSAQSDGHMVIAEKDGAELILGFVEPGEARGFADRCADSSASLGAILMGPLPEADTVMLEEAGIVCFPREDVEEDVLARLLHKKSSAGSDFRRFLDGTYP